MRMGKENVALFAPLHYKHENGQGKRCAVCAICTTSQAREIFLYEAAPRRGGEGGGLYLASNRIRLRRLEHVSGQTGLR